VGAAGTRLVLGKHSGMRGLDARCRALGYRLGEADLERVYRSMTDLADRSKTVSDEQLAVLLEEGTTRIAPAVAGAGRQAAVGPRGQRTAWR
jgi:2-isopropylmalate synthase